MAESQRAVARAGALGRLPRALALPIAIAGILAGCGSSDSIAPKPPAAILAAARNAALHASSVHIQYIDTQGRLKLSTDSELARGGGRTRISFARLSYEAIRIGNTVYVKGNTVFAKDLKHITHTSVPADTWLAGPVNTGSLASFARFTELPDQLNVLLPAGVPTTKGPITTISGRKAIQLQQTAKLYVATLYIPATGAPYPIQRTKHGKETGTTTFTSWNQPVTLSPPTPTIQLSRLEHGER